MKLIDCFSKPGFIYRPPSVYTYFIHSIKKPFIYTISQQYDDKEICIVKRNGNKKRVKLYYYQNDLKVDDLTQFDSKRNLSEKNLIQYLYHIRTIINNYKNSTGELAIISWQSNLDFIDYFSFYRKFKGPSLCSIINCNEEQVFRAEDLELLIYKPGKWKKQLLEISAYVLKKANKKF